MNPFTSTIVTPLLSNGYQESELAKFKEIYRRRNDVLCEALENCVSKHRFTFKKPEGGFFVWLSFHDKRVDTSKLLTIAKTHKVGFQPGVKFSAENSFANYLRMSFAYYDEPELREAVTRLSKAIEEYFAENKL